MLQFSGGNGLRAPGSLGAHDGVQDDGQLAHAGYERYFLVFASNNKVLVLLPGQKIQLRPGQVFRRFS